MPLISYISMPIVNKETTHMLKLDLITNRIYYKMPDGRYALMDSLYRFAQDTTNPLTDDASSYCENYCCLGC